MPKATILIGCPGAGKSTIASRYTWHDSYLVYLSADSIRQELYGDVSVQGNKEVFDLFYKRLKQYVSEGSDIIIDNTSVKAKSRKDILELLTMDYKITYLLINTPLKTCIKRNSERERKVPEDVIIRMHEILQQNLPLIYQECLQYNISLEEIGKELEF